MKTRRGIFFVIILILIIALGIFLWEAYKQSDTRLVLFGEFEIRETDEGKIIEHKKTNFRMKLPLDWDIKDSGWGSIFSYSSDFKFNNEATKFYFYPVLDSGCAIDISIDKGIDSMSYSYVSGTLKLCLEKPDDDYCDYNVIEIDKNKSLKHISHIENELTIGDHIIIEVPQNENVYIFEAYLFGQDREKCAREFEEILKTVKIGG